MHAVYCAFHYPDNGLLPKLIIMVALAYALSPIDLIPDFIPVIRLMDDLIIVPFLIALSVKLIQADILQEYRRKALKEPAGLRKNWLTAIIFIIIWIFLMYIIARPIVKLIFKI